MDNNGRAGERDKSVSPVPSKEECDAAYSKARTSLDSRAAPFVPGIGRLSQDFNSMDLTSTSPPESEAGAEAESEEGGYRRGSGGLLVRSHRNIPSLTAALGVDLGAVAGVGLVDTATGRSSTGSEESRPSSSASVGRRSSGSGGGGLEASAGRRRSGSGGFVVRTHRDTPPLSTLHTQGETPKTSPEKTLTQGQGEQGEREQGSLTPSTEMSSPPPPPPAPVEMSPPPPPPPAPVVPSRPEEEEAEADRSCDCESTDPVTKASAWEKATSSILSGDDNSGTGSTGVSASHVRVSPAETLDIRIFCGTWNVAGRSLDSMDEIGEWLDVDKLDGEDEASDPPDLFVVGFQEVVELSAQNVVMDSFLDTQSRSNSLQWFTHVYAYLAQYGERHGVKYGMVSEQRLLGTYVLVMATEALCTKIAHVQNAFVPTGLGGYFGNKGAVAVRMELAGASSLCFVCVHMAAHRENVAARNNEYSLISSKPIFADTAGRVPTDESENTAGSEKEKDTDKRQTGTWGGLFGAAGQGGRSGGMSPTRSSEVKKAIRAAMAFGLPKGAGGGGAGGGGGKESGRTTPTGVKVKGGGPEMDGAGKGTGDGDSGGAGRDGEEEEEEEEFAWEPSVRRMDAGLPKTKTVLQADIVFWLGDLNYRIAEDVPDQQVFEMLKTDNLEFLRGKDQLNIARASGAAFQEFQEGPLCFPPTYKYIPGTRDLDNRPEKKVRCPSWCDRVLYSVGMQSGDAVKRLGLDRYWSSGPLVSDHMPVSALFRTSLACAPEKSVDEPEMEVESLSPRKAAAQAAFELTPFARITLEPPALVLSLDRRPLQSTAVTIANAGGMKGKFHVCEDSLPEWMSLDGSDGIHRGELGPGEKVEIGIVVDVAEAEAAAERESGSLDGPRQACALLRVEVDGGGSGTFLPVVGTLGD